MTTSEDDRTPYADNPGPHPWRRYVALGDSFTEGIGDPEPDLPGGHRGWADRVAEVLSQQVADFAYANLAVRGKLIRQIVETQIEPAIALKPDLITFSAGGNDVIRPGTDPDAIAQLFEDAVVRLSQTGATARRVHGHRHELHAGVPRHPRQGRDLQRERPRHRRPVRLHRRRPVGAQRGAGHALLRRRPPALQLARAPRGGANGAARAQRAERPAADAARSAAQPHLARGARRRPRLGARVPGAVGAAAPAPPVLG